jgi:hypothetical protein
LISFENRAVKPDAVLATWSGAEGLLVAIPKFPFASKREISPEPPTFVKTKGAALDEEVAVPDWI